MKTSTRRRAARIGKYSCIYVTYRRTSVSVLTPHPSVQLYTQYTVQLGSQIILENYAANAFFHAMKIPNPPNGRALDVLLEAKI